MVQVTDPADVAGEGELAWYFEEHLRYPFLDKDREAQAVRQIVEYGQGLFSQVFGGAASPDHRGLRERSFAGRRGGARGSGALRRPAPGASAGPGPAAPL